MANIAKITNASATWLLKATQVYEATLHVNGKNI